MNAKNINIATILDKNYIVRTLAFYEALIKFGEEYTFWLLCLDNETKEIINRLDLKNIIAMKVDEINDQELLSSRTNRNIAEFAFTSKSAWINYIFNHTKKGDNLIYADNDVIYFSTPNNVLDRMRKNGYSIGITAHRFAKKQEQLNEKIGKYNAGLIYFIVDDNSRECVREWRKQCIDWCYLKHEEGKFGDQLYMNKWPEKYKAVYEIPDKGVNVGSWNLHNYKITKKDNIFFVDDDLLVCYHFHRIRFYIDGDNIKPLPIYIYHSELYKIYTEYIEKSWKKMLFQNKNWSYGFVNRPNILKLIKQNIERFLRVF